MIQYQWHIIKDNLSHIMLLLPLSLSILCTSKKSKETDFAYNYYSLINWIQALSESFFRVSTHECDFTCRGIFNDT